MKDLLDSDVISILLSNDLSVGRHLDNLCKYYAPRVLQHYIHLKEDIMKLLYKYIISVVSGLQADKWKNIYRTEKKYVNLYIMKGKEVTRSRLFLNALSVGLALNVGV
jgi:hypothetical protein